MKKITLGNILLFVWLVLCIVVYIYFPARRSYLQSFDIFTSPFSIENLSGFLSAGYWVNFIFSFLGVLLFTFACISLGGFINKVIRNNELTKSNITLSNLVNLGTYFLIGNACYSIIFITLAGLYQINVTLVLVSWLIGILVGFREIIEYFKIFSVRSAVKNSGLFWVNAFIFISTLLLSSARISYDSTAIYFSYAKITAYLGEIQYFTEDTFVASAFQNTIQFTAIIQLFGEQSARMFSWICGLVIIIFTLALAEKLNISQKAQPILTTILLTSTAFVDLLGDGKVDLINSAISISVIYWLTASETKKGYLLIGFLAGMSIIGRPYNAFLFTVFIFLFYFQKTILQNGLNRHSLKIFITPLFWIGLSAIPIGIFHLFANWMIQEHPLAFLNSLSNINPATGPWDNKPEEILTLRLLYPLAATFRNTPQSLGNISPLVIGFVPFIFLSTIRNKINFSPETKTLTISSCITLLLWIFLFFTVVELRYVFFLWFVLFIPAAQIISTTLENEDKFFMFVKQALIFILLFFIIIRTLIISTVTYSPVDQNKNPQCKDYILCESLIAINESALPNERVLSLSAYRYYLRNDLFVCSSKHTDYTLLKQSAQKNTNSFWEEVIRQGYSYIAYEFDYTTRHLQLGFIPSSENTPEWIKLERLDTVNSEAVAAYKIHLTNPPIESEYNCRKNNKNILEVQLLP
jgi:hypothetical protein